MEENSNATEGSFLLTGTIAEEKPSTNLKYFCHSILSMEGAMTAPSVLGSRFGIGRACEVKGQMAVMALSAP